MADPSLFTKSSLMELKQMVDDFPYFHAVRMLYLKNLAMLDDVRLKKELKKMAVFIPDRRQLFMHIEGFRRVRRGVPVVEPEKQMKKDVDRQTSPAPAPKVNLPVLSPNLASDYVNWLEANTDDLPAENGTENRLKRQDLIDTFIEHESKQLGNRLNPPPVVAPPQMEKEEEKTESMPLESEAFDKTSLDDSFFTETLARVYIGQKRYDKALEIIRVLNLKYPEKSIYFADQIRFLEKIINIKK
jgi:hypothetical protein